MLTDTDITTMFKTAEQEVPHEMCGLLFRVQGFVPCWNVADEPEHSFEIAHTEFLGVIDRLKEEPWAIVHSHPNNGARGSPRDYQLMDALQIAQMRLHMVIIGLKPREIRIYAKHDSLYQMVYFQGEELLATK